MNRGVKNITQDELKAILNYNPETGVFTWKVCLAPNAPIGSEAGCIEKTYGYHLIGIDKASYRAHRLAWLYMTGETPSEQIDHINGNRSDNRFCNLRVATISQNAHNQRTPKNNTSGVKGVCWHKGNKRWVARVKINDRYKYVGGFENFDDAVNAITKAREELHGQYANHG